MEIHHASEVPPVPLVSEMGTLLLSRGPCGSIYPVDTPVQLGSLSTDLPTLGWGTFSAWTTSTRAGGGL